MELISGEILSLFYSDTEDALYSRSFDLIPNFSLWELRCRGTGTLPIAAKYFKVMHTAFKLQNLREHIGSPIYVRRWFSTPQHNEAVGGSITSLHLEGAAVDIFSKVLLEDLARSAFVHGFTGIGYYPHKGIIHVDIRDLPLYWIEDAEGKRTYYNAEQLNDFLERLK